MEVPIRVNIIQMRKNNLLIYTTHHTLHKLV